MRVAIDHVLSSFTETQKLPSPLPSDVAYYRAYLTLTRPITDTETHFLDSTDDLVSLMRRRSRRRRSISTSSSSSFSSSVADDGVSPTSPEPVAPEVIVGGGNVHRPAGVFWDDALTPMPRPRPPRFPSAGSIFEAPSTPCPAAGASPMKVRLSEIRAADSEMPAWWQQPSPPSSSIQMRGLLLMLLVMLLPPLLAFTVLRATVLRMVLVSVLAMSGLFWIGTVSGRGRNGGFRREDLMVLAGGACGAIVTVVAALAPLAGFDTRLA